MNIAAWLHRAGLSHPGLPAVGHGSRVTQSYGALAERAARLANALHGLGLKPGDRVAIIAKNCVEYVETIHGIWHGGYAAVPANAKLHGRELGYILEHSGARVCFATPGLDEEVAPYTPASLERLIVIGSDKYDALFAADPMPVVPRDGDDLAWLFYTSGTTGRPKGAMLTHRNLAQASFAYLTEVDSAAPGDSILHAAPMSHGSGLYMMAHVARMGINVVPESGSFEPDEIFRMFAAWRGMSMFAAPTMVKRLVDFGGGAEPSNLRTIVWGGAPMYVEDALKALDRFGPRLAQIYGQGESPMTITVLSRQDIADREHPRWLERLGSAGRPYACLEVKVADAQDNALPVGEVGEIICRGDMVMPGYWKNPDATAQTMRGGWLHTGDVGVFDADGYLTLEGPLQGHDHLGWLEHLSARGRGGAAQARECARGLGDRPPASRMGRGRRRLCGRRGAGAGAGRAVPRRDRALQAAEGLRVRRRAAEEQLRQDPENRIARTRREAKGEGQWLTA